VLQVDLLRVHGAEQLRALARDLRREADGKEIRRELTRELRAVANQTRDAERRAVLALPSKGESERRGRRPLRRRFATATVVQLRTGAKDPAVSVLLNPNKMPPGQQSLPAYFNREEGFERLRHPVFGTDTYVSQDVHPWFYETARRAEHDAQLRLIGVIDRAADRLERG
jgi:hypothetical protein